MSVQLHAALQALDGDVEELESTIRVVESGGPRMFGIVRRRYALCPC